MARFERQLPVGLDADREGRSVLSDLLWTSLGSSLLSLANIGLVTDESPFGSLCMTSFIFTPSSFGDVGSAVIPGIPSTGAACGEPSPGGPPPDIASTFPPLPNSHHD
eukprot:gene17985-biopygen18201